MSAEEAITIEYRGKVAIVTLNQPKKLNALTSDLYYRLAMCMHEVAGRDDIYVTVLTAVLTSLSETLLPKTRTSAAFGSRISSPTTYISLMPSIRTPRSSSQPSMAPQSAHLLR